MPSCCQLHATQTEKKRDFVYHFIKTVEKWIWKPCFDLTCYLCCRFGALAREVQVQTTLYVAAYQCASN